MSDFIDEGLMKDFFDEAFSQIDVIEENLLILEKDIENKESIDAVFRAAHTLKGGSATVQMKEITDFTHILEDVMDAIREGSVKINSSIIDILLDALDIIKSMVNERSNNNIYSGDYSEVVNNLKSIIEDSDKKIEKKKDIKKAKSGNVKDSEFINNELFNITEYDLLEIKEANTDNLPIYKILVILDETNPMRTVGGIQIFTSLREIGLVLKTIPEFDEIYSDVFHREIMYILASKSTIEQITDYATIPDATKKVIVLPIDSGNIKQDKKSDVVKKEEKKTLIIKQEKKDNIKRITKSETEDEDIDDIEDIEDQIKQHGSDKSKDTGEKKKIISSILRVDSSRIDALLNLVSEIVINKATFNQIESKLLENIELFNYTIGEYKDKLKAFFDKIPTMISEERDDDLFKNLKDNLKEDYNSLALQFDNFYSYYKSIVSVFKSNNQILDRISSSLQEGVMRVRMVPMKNIFNRFPRLVRDLSKGLKKDINLIIKGEDTEIDKAMIDDLVDPLIHIVRNSIDHGFETPEERESQGKPNPATLEIQAINEGNIINITVSDDGRGIDIEKIRKKAIEKNIISSDTILKEQDAFNLLFEPGFSTASKVTEVSGRGVGLDVVKKNIEKLSGSIRITSEQGLGSIFSIKIPLTLAIIQGLMVDVYEEKYVIPISSVIESIRIDPKDIKSIDNYEVINVRADVLSLLRLNKLFNLGDNKDSEYYFVVIVGTANKKIGLLVDSVIGEEDIVIKPLKDKYTNTPGIAGATILGDGTVSLILDISQLIELGLKIEEEKHKIIK